MAPLSATGELTNAAAAVLGMVAIGASSGYEIKRAAELSLRFFWALGPPQIYAELQRLEEAGLLKGTDAARGQRQRRTFTVTRNGRAALKRWLQQSEPGVLEMRDPELLRLFFSDALDPEGVSERFAVIRERSQAALDQFSREILPAAERTQEAGFALPREVAQFGVDLHEFIVGWCDGRL